MRRGVFLLSFAVVAAATLSVVASLVLGFAKVNVGSLGWLAILGRFSDPIPSLFSMHMPLVLRLLVSVLFAGLVIRRLVTFVRERRFNVPASYSGVPYVLLCLAAASLVLGAIALVLVVLSPPGHFMVAIRILNPAMLLAPLAIAWGELKSLGSRSNAVP